MKIYKSLITNEGLTPKEEIPHEKALRNLEKSGYYKKGIVNEILNNNEPVTLRTPFAYFYFEKQ